MDFNSTRSAMLISDGAIVTLNESNFERISLAAPDEEDAVVSVNAGLGPDQLELYTEHSVQQEATVLRMQQCQFSQNKSPYNLAASSLWISSAAHETKIFSDVEMEVFMAEEGTVGTTLPLKQAQASRPGINESSSWYLSVQQVRHLHIALEHIAE